MKDRDRKMIEMRPIGFVSRTSPNENDRDRSLVAKVVFDKDLVPALDGIEVGVGFTSLRFTHLIPRIGDDRSPRERLYLQHRGL